MAFWKLACWPPAAVGSGRPVATEAVLVSAGLPQLLRGMGADLGVVPGWLLGVGIVAVVLAAAGLFVWRRRPGRIAKPPGGGFPWTGEHCRQFFDRIPVQILEEDFTALEELFARLRGEGVTDMINHLAAHPGLLREWLGRVRLTYANQRAVAAAGFTGWQEMTERFPQNTEPPYLDIFQFQLGAVWAGRRLFQEEFRYRDAGGRERACLMQCRVEERRGKPDFSRVMLVLVDITASKWAALAQMESQDLMSRILARADILLWWAQVRLENGRLGWKINVPEPLFDTPLLKLATARDRNGLWETERVPDFDAITAQATEAILQGSPGYQHEFRVLSGAGATHWLSEKVGISRLRPDEWSLVGVVMDVTAQHEAEEERSKSEAQLKEILTRADCMIWHANVLREGDGLRWCNFTMPGSALCDRLFGEKPPATGSGLWYDGDTLDLAEMNRRSTAAILSGAPGYDQEFPVLRPEKTLWLHEQVSITPVGAGRWNLVGVLMDVTARHEAEEERRKSQAQLKQILSRADCMVWQACVTESAGQFSWEFDIPPSGLQKRIFGGDTGVVHAGVSGIRARSLYGSFVVPEQAEMDDRALGALRGGAPGYEQQFHLVRGDRAFWLYERVSVMSAQPGRWDLVGITVDVTAQHDAEEARRKTEVQLQQILDRTDCMVWQARVTEENGRISWLFDVPASGLQRRIFGCDGMRNTPVLYESPGFTVPEISDMYILGANALRSGAPGYEHEFRIVKPDRTYWLQERGIIMSQGPGRWPVFGLVIDISQLKKAEQVILASEARYRDLFEGAVEGVFQSTPQGNLISVNPALARIFGCATPAELLAMTENGAKSVYVREGRREEFFAELGARDSVTDFESEVYCRDGSIKWISENVRAVRDASGRLLHMQGFLSDVTERHKALTAVKESESRYRALFENIPVAILELDLRELGWMLGKWRAAGVRDLTAHLAGHPGEFPALSTSIGMAAVNETAVRLFKAESKAHLQNEISRLFTAPVVGVLQRWLEAIWQGHNDGEAEAELADFVGGCHHTFLRWWMPRQAGEFQLDHAVVALVDLTELKQVEAALAAEKERLAVTLRAMAEGVITTDTRGIVQFINRAAAELTQCDAATAVGRPLAEICVLRGPRSDEAVPLPLAQVLEERAPVDLPPQTRIVGAGGATCLVEGCCAPVNSAESEIIGAVLVVRDVTVRQRLEEELERASRLESIGILAGGIAHDFNNILTAVMGNIALALLDASGLVTVERYLKEAERATLRARDLTQQLLTFARGGSRCGPRCRCRRPSAR